VSLILATGSNIGDKLKNLSIAQDLLSQNFQLIKASRVYTSEPVDYLEQPEFFNQVLEFKLPLSGQLETFEIIKAIESQIGTEKTIFKGPRKIDIDIIFYGLEHFDHDKLTIPHLSWSKRSFVVKPLKELPFYDIIKNNFDVPCVFESNAQPINNKDK